jgi:hypothetical protein
VDELNDESDRSACRKPWYEGPLLLLFPYVVLAVIHFGYGSRLGRQIREYVPPQWENSKFAGIGVLALFAGCFAGWAYFRNRQQGYKGAALIAARTILMTFLLFAASFGVWLIFALLFAPAW